MMAKQLAKLAADVSLYGNNIRNLNFSYNSLDFVDEFGYEESTEFMEHICRFFKKDTYLNHLNFAGMNFDKEHLLELVDAM